jgi:hypothetical protein
LNKKVIYKSLPLKHINKMKKFFLKPGFEFIFSLSLIVILGLPPMLLAQSQKDVEIKIENGDTTVNGKNIKDLSAADRKNALRDIRHINDDGSRHTYSLERKDTVGGKGERFRLRIRKETGDRQPMITENIIVKDSLGNIVAVKPGRHRVAEQQFALKYRSNDDANDFGGRGPNGSGRSPMGRFERKNSQSFEYVNTDNDGISTHVRFHVSEVSNEDLKKMPHVEGGKFEINDLNLVPEFSTGKTLLMFNLPAKALAEIKLIDSEGKVVWNERSTSGSFSKTFVLGLNGIYYLQIKQGNNIAIKRIMKEE